MCMPKYIIADNHELISKDDNILNYVVVIEKLSGATHIWKYD